KRACSTVKPKSDKGFPISGVVGLLGKPGNHTIPILLFTVASERYSSPRISEFPTYAINFFLLSLTFLFFLQYMSLKISDPWRRIKWHLSYLCIHQSLFLPEVLCLVAICRIPNDRLLHLIIFYYLSITC